MPATYVHWAADPILIDYEEKTYLFYEVVDNNRGYIAVSEVRDDCSLSDPVVVLKDDNHYSYPFVFQWNNQWYMIPESSSAGEVRLYKSVEFPSKWELTCILLKQVSVDSTVFETNGAIYLLTYFLCPGTECVVPKAYLLDLSQNVPKVTPIAWDTYDELKCRGAGPIFSIGNKLIRPAQRNENNQYGNGVIFYQLQLSHDKYQEKHIGSLEYENITVNFDVVDGLHTYSRSKRFEAIDIRCREFDFLKTPRVLWNKLKHNK